MQSTNSAHIDPFMINVRGMHDAYPSFAHSTPVQGETMVPFLQGTAQLAPDEPLQQWELDLITSRVHPEVPVIVQPSQWQEAQCPAPIIQPPQWEEVQCQVPIMQQPQWQEAQCLAPVMQPSQWQEAQCPAPIIQPPQWQETQCQAPIIQPPQWQETQCLAPVMQPPQFQEAQCLTPVMQPSQWQEAQCPAPVMQPYQWQETQCPAPPMDTIQGAQQQWGPADPSPSPYPYPQQPIPLPQDPAPPVTYAGIPPPPLPEWGHTNPEVPCLDGSIGWAQNLPAPFMAGGVPEWFTTQSENTTSKTPSLTSHTAVSARSTPPTAIIPGPPGPPPPPAPAAPASTASTARVNKGKGRATSNNTRASRRISQPTRRRKPKAKLRPQDVEPFLADIAKRVIIGRVALPEDVKPDINQWEVAQVCVTKMLVGGKLPEWFGIGAIKAGKRTESGEREWTRGFVHILSLREAPRGG